MKLIPYVLLFLSPSVWASGEYIKPPGKIQELIKDKAQSYGISPYVFEALIRWESSFDTEAVNHEGSEDRNEWSVGLGQVKYNTAHMIGFRGEWDELKDPETNLDLSATYLKYQVERYLGDYYKAVSAYNAGTFFRRHKNAFYTKRIISYAKYLEEKSGRGE